jgi:hypothetical protein
MALLGQIEYRYYLTDLMSNEVISEVPFSDVSYERVNRKAGKFSGTIPFIETTKGLDLYQATMPGRTGLYVLRNGECVWGGIIWSREYNVRSRSLSVEGAEFTSYFYHRNIWQTIQYGSNFIGVSAYQVSSGVATITIELPHGFSVGDTVRITATNPIVDGTHTITAIPSANQYRFSASFGDGSGLSTSGACRSLVDTYDFARDLVFRMNTDLGGVQFANEFIKPALEFETSVISKQRSANIVTLRTSTPHKIIPGQEIEVVEVGSDVDGFHIALENPDEFTVRYELLGPNSPRETLPGIRTLNVVSKRLISNVVTIQVDQPHGASPGQTVVLTGVDAFFITTADPTFNGRFTVTSTPTPTTFTYSSGGILDIAGPNGEALTVAGGIATFGAKAIYGDFGSFTSNGNIGIEFESFVKSGFYQDTQVFRGFEQKTVGEILEQYSNVVEGGFEYRIDCDYDFDTSTFSRTFRVFPIDFAVPPPPGEVYAVTDFGAEKLVFEYPGNIETFNISESAENSATRFFVVGRIEDLGDEASQPYAGASAEDMLDNKSGRSWPLLDQVEQLDEIENEFALHQYARDYLYESRPPVGTYKISVNGSLAPEVGSYSPGEWCSLIIDDEFVRQRLANDQEPRDDILIRKISSYKVSVPNSPFFPEKVDLELVTDWKVDRRGD